MSGVQLYLPESGDNMTISVNIWTLPSYDALLEAANVYGIQMHTLYSKIFISLLCFVSCVIR